MGVDQQNLPSLVQKSVRRTSPVSHSRTSTLWSRSQSEKPSLSLVQNSVKRTSPLSSRSHSELPLSPIQKLVSRTSTPWSRSQSREPPLSLIRKSVGRTSTLSSRSQSGKPPLSLSKSKTGEPPLSHPYVSQNLPFSSIGVEILGSLVQKTVRRTPPLSRR